MSVEIGYTVEARTIPGTLFASGKVVAISDAPMALIETGSGEKVWWCRDLCKPASDEASDQDKRCGTCKWWSELELEARGNCNFPLPPLPDSVCSEGWMRRNDGKKCPCWEGKE